MPNNYDLPTLGDTERLAGELMAMLRPGDVVALTGELGVGKTTFVRAALRSIGYDGPVRSPTFNLLQVYDVDPPILHADLYRAKSIDGIGIEDYLETHVCFVEWPDRAGDAFGEFVWRIAFEFAGEGRRASIEAPSGITPP